MSTSIYYKRPNSLDVITEVTTRIGIFLGLDFTTTQNLELNSNKYLSTIPSFSFSSDFSKVIIDYTNSQNDTDKNLLKGLFAGLTAGTTFNISSASYTIDGIGSEANLGGTYEFISYVNQVIVAKPITLNNKNNRLLRYESDYFINPPQFGLSLAPQSKVTEYVIVNALGTDKTTSFAKFGIYPGDKIKITGTQFNNSTFIVKSLTTNKDGSESLIVEDGLTAESAFGYRVGLELIQKRKGIDAIVAATGPTTLGACVIYKNGERINCYDNQTQSQCIARTRMENVPTFNWLANTTCLLAPPIDTSSRTSAFSRQSNVTNPFATLSSLGYLS